MPLDPTPAHMQFPGRDIHYLKSTDSTMAVAAQLAAAGCPTGTVVVADEQTAGQGRFGRVWHSARDAGLYVSVVLRPVLEEENMRVLGMTLGLAAAEAIARTADVQCDLRWPNDVLIGDKKCAGILVTVEGTTFIAGIGINVNQNEFPTELEPIATSLRIATGGPQSREALLVHLLESIDSFVRMLETGGKNPVLAMFTRASSYVRGKHVVVEQESTEIEGVTDGLDDAGFLVVRRSDGSRVTIMAGGVRPKRPASL